MSLSVKTPMAIDMVLGMAFCSEEVRGALANIPASLVRDESKRSIRGALLCQPLEAKARLQEIFLLPFPSGEPAWRTLLEHVQRESLWSRLQQKMDEVRFLTSAGQLSSTQVEELLTLTREWESESAAKTEQASRAREARAASG